MDREPLGSTECSIGSDPTIESVEGMVCEMTFSKHHLFATEVL